MGCFFFDCDYVAKPATAVWFADFAAFAPVLQCWGSWLADVEWVNQFVLTLTFTFTSYVLDDNIYCP